MTSIRARFLLPAVAALFVGVSCADGPTAPDRPIPGSLIVRWTTPHADDRAAVLKLVVPSGMTTGAPELSDPGLESFHHRVADTLRVAVFGTLESGELLRIAVPDVRRAPLVLATVVDAAAADDSARESLAGYMLVVERP